MQYIGKKFLLPSSTYSLVIKDEQKRNYLYTLQPFCCSTFYNNRLRNLNIFRRSVATKVDPAPEVGMTATLMMARKE
jgi:hypothetical protein